MLFIMSHFFVKAIAFIELVKGISFSIVFIFRISAMRLLKFTNFFSLDLNTYNLNKSRILLINNLLFLKMESLLADSGKFRNSRKYILKQGISIESLSKKNKVSLSHSSVLCFRNRI